MEQTNTMGAETPAVRPTFLTVLCILSFIAAGFAIIGYIAVIGVLGAASALSNVEGMEQMQSSMSSMPSKGLTMTYLIVGFLTTLVGLWGVIKMWKLEKQGFFIYVACSVISMIMGMVYTGFSTMAIIFPILFIGLYYMNLKAMTK